MTIANRPNLVSSQAGHAWLAFRNVAILMARPACDCARYADCRICQEGSLPGQVDEAGENSGPTCRIRAQDLQTTACQSHRPNLALQHRPKPNLAQEHIGQEQAAP